MIYNVFGGTLNLAQSINSFLVCRYNLEISKSSSCIKVIGSWSKSQEEKVGLYIIIIFWLSDVKIPRVKSNVKSKRKAEVVTPRR